MANDFRPCFPPAIPFPRLLDTKTVSDADLPDRAQLGRTLFATLGRSRSLGLRTDVKRYLSSTNSRAAYFACRKFTRFLAIWLNVPRAGSAFCKSTTL